MKEIEKTLFNNLSIVFNSKLSEMHFIGFNDVNKVENVSNCNYDKKDVIESYKCFDEHVEPIKKEILQVIGENNVRPKSRVVVMFEQNDKQILYYFIVQVKSEIIHSKAKDLFNYFYALGYEKCLQAVKIDRDTIINNM